MKMRLKLTAAVILIMLIFTSCAQSPAAQNGDENSTPSETSTTPTEETETANESSDTPVLTESYSMNIGTASVGGAFYPVGQAIATLVSKYVDNITMVPEVTGGAVENPRLVSSGEVDLGITNANLAYFAFEGTEPYTEKLNVKAVGNLHPSIFHMVTLNPDIKTVADLNGKKVAVGPAGGGTLPILELLLEKEGLSLDSIVPSYLAYADGFTQLSDGNVDVALALSGYPASSVMELAATKQISFIEIEPETMEEVLNEYTYYSEIIVPSEEYKTEKPISALGVNNILLVNGDLSEDAVYLITEAIYSHLDEMGDLNATAQQIDRETLSNTAIELHPGSKKYFESN